MIRIIEAANSTLPARAAYIYRQLGFSVIPCIGKQPNGIRWNDFQRWKPSIGQIVTWERQGRFQNVGLICGPVSSNLVVIDLDGVNAVKVFEERWPDLIETYTVVSGSGKGKHIYLYSDKPISTTKAMALPDGGNIELRSNGQLIIAPPSIHPETGKHYLIDKPLPIKSVDLYPCRKWIVGLERQKYIVPADDLKKHDTRPKQGKRAMSVAYAVTALRGECSAVSRLAPNSEQRNNRLNLAAYSLGQLVGDLLLPRWQVEDDLMAAAAACGLPDGEARRTIKSGLDAGIQNPRSLRNG